MLFVLWFSAIGLEALLFARAVPTGLLKHYRMFFFYLGLVLTRDICLLLVYFLRPGLYAHAYWDSELLGVLAGCCLVWEVYRVAFKPFPGAARVARDVLLLLFIFAVARIFVEMWNSPGWTLGRTTLETERDLRIAQGALLVGLVALFTYYAIPLGRNLAGIIYGYAVFVGTSVVNLTARHYLGAAFQHAWEYIQPSCYFLVLSLWCWTLWTYARVPEPEKTPRLEDDYQALVQATRRRISLERGRLLKGMRR